MPGPSSTMFSTMARLLCTPFPSSLFIKKSVKRTTFIIKNLPAHSWLELHNVLYNGQAVVHTVSLLSMYKDKHKKDILYIKSLPAHVWPEFNNVPYNGQAVVHTVSFLSAYKEKHEKNKLYFKKPPGTCLARTPQCSPQWPGCCEHHLPPLCVQRKVGATQKLAVTISY